VIVYWLVLFGVENLRLGLTDAPEDSASLA